MKTPAGYEELLHLVSKLHPDEVRAALRGLRADDGEDMDVWTAKATALLLKVPPRAESAPIEIRLLVTATPGLSHTEVANYVHEAVEGYSGCLTGDDPRRSIHVTRVQRLGWVDVEPEQKG